MIFLKNKIKKVKNDNQIIKTFKIKNHYLKKLIIKNQCIELNLTMRTKCSVIKIIVLFVKSSGREEGNMGKRKF